jgi:16S rRNA (guanine527-N7)-methyltransferase
MADPICGHSGAELLKSIYPVSRETIERLEIYFELLKRWQVKTNLVAPSTLEGFWKRHVADSLQLPALDRVNRNWTDLGSGGGFPGMVIAIAMEQKIEEEGGTSSVCLIESNGKKCSFLRQVANQCGIRPEIVNERIESASKQLFQADIITARALAPLSSLLSMTEGAISGARRAMFHKGRGYEEELKDCHGTWQFDLIVHPGMVDGESVVLEISNAVRVGKS